MENQSTNLSTYVPSNAKGATIAGIIFSRR